MKNYHKTLILFILLWAINIYTFTYFKTGVCGPNWDMISGLLSIVIGFVVTLFALVKMRSNNKDSKVNALISVLGLSSLLSPIIFSLF